MAKILYVYVIIMLFCLNMHAADVSVSKALEFEVEARMALGFAGRALMADMKAHPDIELKNIALPHSTRLDHSKYDPLSPEVKRKYIRRQKLQARYLELRQLVEQRRAIVERAVLFEQRSDDFQERDLELELELLGLSGGSTQQVFSSHYEGVRERSLVVLRGLAESEMKARRVRFAEQGMAQAHSVAGRLLAVWQ